MTDVAKVTLDHSTVMLTWCSRSHGLQLPQIKPCRASLAKRIASSHFPEMWYLESSTLEPTCLQPVPFASPQCFQRYWCLVQGIPVSGAKLSLANSRKGHWKFLRDTRLVSNRRSHGPSLLELHCSTSVRHVVNGFLAL